MSYSFTVRAANKAEAKEKVAAEMAKVVENQPVHAGDQEQAKAVAAAFIDLLPDDADKDVSISVHGSLGWNGSYPSEYVITGASIGASASTVTREVAAA
jgi:hypothetical protein